MSPKEIALFWKIGETAKNYFEFGCGGSTVYIGKKTKASIYTVDSNKHWLNTVRDKLGKRKNITYKHIPLGELGVYGHPVDPSKKHLWPQYSGALEESGFLPDVVLIDGRFRPACILKTIRYSLANDISPKIMVHDCERGAYRLTYKYLTSYATAEKLCVFDVRKNINLTKINKLIKTCESKP
jgi:hypothetical protein